MEKPGPDLIGKEKKTYISLESLDFFSFFLVREFPHEKSTSNLATSFSFSMFFDITKLTVVGLTLEMLKIDFS